MALKRFPPTIIHPTARHTATCIFSHGFGATAADWVTLSELPATRPYVKWVFPQAPLRAISIYGGDPIPAWFDILNQDHGKREKDGDEDEVGMRESLKDLEELVRSEVEGGIASERILVGGFSQGAALALLQGVVGESKVGGLMVLSGYLPLQWKILQMKNDRVDELPIFWAHGTSDAVIKFEKGKGAADTLIESGLSNVTFKSYTGMGHSYCDRELHDLQEWLKVVIPSLDSKM